MGTVIKSVSFAKSGLSRGMLNLSKRSAGVCLKRAGLDISKIGLLINTSLYTENHLSEPALAAMILNKLQAGTTPDKIISTGKGRVFSFDLHNGGGGIINAIQIIDGFIQSEEIENGLIVSGDSKPADSIEGNYIYPDGTGSILLSHDDGIAGFTAFFSATFPEFSDDFRSIIEWGTGKFKFEISRSRDYLRNCVECAYSSVNKFLRNENLSYEDIDLVFTSRSPAELARDLQKNSALGDKIVINGNDEFYSSGFISSLTKLFYNSKFKAAKYILFVSVGAGITVSLALYKNR
ncbi:MAG TPA: hypothetical protein P5180_14845 [Bacteroidales bacterium]|nr:hypothetical protein [Bacteroidales bacterium]HPR74096.1 hypothetical protein [Bacteroidales bacterium]HRW86705.1 hypothetical protein [Bacteroidales bacterium]